MLERSLVVMSLRLCSEMKPYNYRISLEQVLCIHGLEVFKSAIIYYMSINHKNQSV